MLRAAAEQESYGAMVTLGRLYSSGIPPVAKDVVTAYMWYDIVLEKGALIASALSVWGLPFEQASMEAASAGARKLEAAMSGSQVAEAKRKAAAWIATHH